MSAAKKKAKAPTRKLKPEPPKVGDWWCVVIRDGERDLVTLNNAGSLAGRKLLIATGEESALLTAQDVRNLRRSLNDWLGVAR